MADHPPAPNRHQGHHSRQNYSVREWPMLPNYTSCREHFEALERQQQQSNSSSRFLTLTSIPVMQYIPPQQSPSSALEKDDQNTTSPFLRLPTEIRLQIYSLLVLPREATYLCPSREKVASSVQDSFDYEKRQRGTDRPLMADLSNPTLCMRTLEGTSYEGRFGRGMSRASHCRSTYTIRSGRFRAQCMSTTYHCVNNPRIEDQVGILRVNKQIHAEATELLYSSYTFDFDTHIEAIRPFLNDLTPFARSCVKSIRFVKRGLAYDKEFDRAEWNTALRYLTDCDSGVNLRRLELGIVAGRPGPTGWDRIATYIPQDFALLQTSTESMFWIQYLLEFRNLQELIVNAIVEHCAPANNSLAMANFIRFSASIEDGFSKYLHQNLVKV